MKNRLSLLVVFAVSSVSFSHCASAYDVYKTPLTQRYHLRTVACRACHPTTKDHKILNKFGQMFADELNGQGTTKKYEAAKAKGEEQKKQFEAEMVKTFITVLPVVEKKTMTVEDMITAGLLNGTRLEDKKTPSEKKVTQSTK